MVRVVFILSTRRAGSTWLGAVLGSHTWAASVGEYVRPFREPGSVVCRQCEADGLATCTVFDGIDHVAAEDAFAFAAARLPGRVLIDASKRVPWCARFAERADLDVRAIHLVRHPAGVLESESRRRPEAPVEEILASWETRNAEIEAFLDRSGIPHALVSYEQLADDPASTLPPLCAFAGGAYEAAALAYWNFPHHGPGANGAASLYLRGRSAHNYVTGDDVFYDQLRAAAPAGADARWKTRLPPALVGQAVGSPYAVSLAARLGVRWNADGAP